MTMGASFLVCSEKRDEDDTLLVGATGWPFGRGFNRKDAVFVSRANKSVKKNISSARFLIYRPITEAYLLRFLKNLRTEKLQPSPGTGLLWYSSLPGWAARNIKFKLGKD